MIITGILPGNIANDLNVELNKVMIKGSDIDINITLNDRLTSFNAIGIGNDTFEITELDDGANLFPTFEEGDVINKDEVSDALFDGSINSSAINTPQLISDAADKFGSQCVVVAIDARKRTDGSGWNVYKNGGRIDTGLDAIEWAIKADKMGAGEILLTSMDCDGTKNGYDIELTRLISENVSVPVIASGGAGTKEHFYEALTEGKADAALAASLFHYKELEIMDLKKYLADNGVSVRR